MRNLKEIKFIKSTYKSILKGTATNSDIDKASMLITGDNFTESLTIATIIKYMKNDYEAEYSFCQKFAEDIERIKHLKNIRG
jgi:hypothetical protein